VNFYLFFCPNPVNIMNCTKDKNETVIERTQMNKNANKKVVRKLKLEAGEEYVSTAGKLIPPKIFVDTPTTVHYSAMKPHQRTKERIFKDMWFLCVLTVKNSLLENKTPISEMKFLFLTLSLNISTLVCCGLVTSGL
jgi:hypothetical protein